MINVTITEELNDVPLNSQEFLILDEDLDKFLQICFENDKTVILGKVNNGK